MYIDKINEDFFLGLPNNKEVIEENTFKIDNYISNYENISDLDKIDAINTVYRVCLSNQEFIDIINKMNNSNYSKIVDIPTKMEFSDVTTYKNGRKYYYSPIVVKLVLTCVVGEEYSFNKDFSHDEIMSLVNNKIIYPFMIKSKNMLSHSDNYEKLYDIEGYDFEQVYVNHYGNYDFIPNENNSKYLLDVINSNVDRKTIISDMKRYLEELRNELSYSFWKLSNEEKDALMTLIKVYNKNK